jgi:peroxiredoxin
MTRYAMVFALSVLVSGTVSAVVKVGATAPDFNLVDSYGKKQSLAANKGKWVVLEWLNHGCPFVRKHYDAGNMQALQKKYTEKGVVWYSVISSAPGRQGSGTAEEVNADFATNKSVATAVLLDPAGTVGKAYGASTTPNMFVIDPKGKLAYMGAIDDKASTDVKDVATAKNYVAAALDAGIAGKAIATATTKPYGCSVKYAN